MRVFGCGAEPINPATMRAFVEHASRTRGLKPEALLPCYGMAEATLAISFIGARRAAHDRRRSTPTRYQRPQGRAGARRELRAAALEFVSCGKTFPGHDRRLRRGRQAPLSERRVGEIWVRGPVDRQGYFEDAEATAAHVRQAAGCAPATSATSSNGNVYITGRKKDIIIVNGRNYDPQRIEWIVDDVPEVRKGSTVAFSRPGPGSEELVIVVESRTQKPDELKELVKQRINENLQLMPADVVIAPLGTPAQDLERQAAAREDPPAVPRGHRRHRRRAHARRQRREAGRRPARRQVAHRPRAAPRPPVVEHTLEIRSVVRRGGRSSSWSAPTRRSA